MDKRYHASFVLYYGHDQTQPRSSFESPETSKSQCHVANKASKGQDDEKQTNRQTSPNGERLAWLGCLFISELVIFLMSSEPPPPEMRCFLQRGPKF